MAKPVRQRSGRPTWSHIQRVGQVRMKAITEAIRSAHSSPQQGQWAIFLTLARDGYLFLWSPFPSQLLRLTELLRGQFIRNLVSCFGVSFLIIAAGA
jgi:hypothetical protein